MLDPKHREILEAAARRGQALHGQSLSERLEALEAPARNNPANYAILGLALCLEHNLPIPIPDAEYDPLRWRFQEDLPLYFASPASPRDLRRDHINAARFLLERLASLAGSMGITLSPRSD